MKHHSFPADVFDELAAGHGGYAAVTALHAGQLSRRKTQLLALYSVVDDRHGRQAREAGMPDAYRLLAAAERVDGLAVARVLLQPGVGAWLADTLRRLRTGEPDPRWLTAGLAHLAAVAAVACSAAGYDFSAELRVGRGGAVTLPGLGVVRVGVPEGARVPVTGTAGRLNVAGVAAAGPEHDRWLPQHLLTATDGDLAFSAVLDDLDPYRDCHGLGAVDRLDTERVKVWQYHLADAWQLMVARHRRYAEAIAAGMSSVVPIAADEVAKGMSATSREAFGSVSMTEPTDGLGFAVTLVHEFQHAKLGAMLDLVPLYDTADDRLHYAPWREDPRPLGGLFQGAYAFLGVADFWRMERRAVDADRKGFADFEFARWRERVSRVLDVLQGSGSFLPHGLRFLSGMRATLDSWRDERVPQAVAALARHAADDHRITWRIRNLRPSRSCIDVAAAAWLAAGPAPDLDTIPSTPVPRPRRAEAAPRLDLACLRLTDRTRFDRLVADPAVLRREIPTASPGDAALVAGDPAAALAAYGRQLGPDPDDPAVWAGLTLAAERARAGPGVDALTGRPEVVYAVYRAIRRVTADPPDPLVLAGWLAGL